MLCKVRRMEIGESEGMTVISYRIVREHFGDKFTLEQIPGGE